MTDINIIPNEILLKIFYFLGIKDLLIIRLVCHQWNEITSVLLINRVVITISQDIGGAAQIFSKSLPDYKHWVFKDVYMNLKAPFEVKWSQHFKSIESLALIDVEISERDLITILKNCYNLKSLILSGLIHLLMIGTFLDNFEERKLLKCSLPHLECLHLSIPRYLTDSVFARIIFLVTQLRELSLSSCQISFQNSIWKRFYPTDGNIKSSEHVLTFNHILYYIENHKKYLKSLNLSQTTVDSESLIRLSELEDLKLESVHLVACYQLTKAGIQTLCQNQPHLTELDISLCPRITDFAIIDIAEFLPRLKYLNIRQCRSITEVGLENIAKLTCLERLDVGHLPIRKWESIHEALGKVYRPTLLYLSAASLPMQWETVAELADKAPNLQYLDLSMCIVGVTDKSIQVICKKLTKLETLNVAGCIAVSDIGLAGYSVGGNPTSFSEISHIGNALSLECLGLKDRNPYKIPLGSKAEQEIRQEAEVLKYLEENVDEIIHSCDCGLSHLENLKYINLYGCLRVTDITLVYAIHFLELQYLNLSYCQQITEDGLIEIAINCSSLEELYLRECSFTTDQAVLVISHRLKRIRTFDVQRCNLLTNDAMDHLSHCISLHHLDVSYCDKITIEGVSLLMERLPNLQNLYHRGIPSHNDEKVDTEVPKAPPLISKLLKKFSMHQ